VEPTGAIVETIEGTPVPSVIVGDDVKTAGLSSSATTEIMDVRGIADRHEHGEDKGCPHPVRIHFNIYPKIAASKLGSGPMP
jgi:hypothetical protein